MAAAAIRIGISGWRYAPWRGRFYPAGLAQRQELAFASRVLPTIEINGSFYSLQRPSSYEAWHDETPAGFVFAVKGPRYITHMRRLNDVRVPLANFLASGVLALREKLARGSIGLEDAPLPVEEHCAHRKPIEHPRVEDALDLGNVEARTQLHRGRQMRQQEIADRTLARTETLAAVRSRNPETASGLSPHTDVGCHVIADVERRVKLPVVRTRQPLVVIDQVFQSDHPIARQVDKRVDRVPVGVKAGGQFGLGLP